MPENRITAQMNFTDVMRLLPRAVDIFKTFGLDCSCCQMAEFENLEHGCRVHDVDIEELLDALNQAQN